MTEHAERASKDNNERKSQVPHSQIETKSQYGIHPHNTSIHSAVATATNRSIESGNLSPNQIMRLQKTIGNQAVIQLLRQNNVSTPFSASEKASEPIQRVSLIQDSQSIETDHYSVDTLRKMTWGLWNNLKFSEENLEKLKREIKIREKKTPFPIPAKEPNPKQKEEKYKTTLKKNLQARKLIIKLLKEGLDNKDKILVNSCEFALSGNYKVFAITPLEENYEVLSAATKNDKSSESVYILEEFVLLYPKAESATQKGDIFTDEQPGYNYKDYTKVLDDPNIGVETSRRTKGWNMNGALAIVVDSDEKDVKEYLYSVLKHEVQHSADGSVTESKRDPKNVLDLAVARFETEYRAFAIMGHPRVIELQEKGEQNVLEPSMWDEKLNVSKLHNLLSMLAFQDLKDDFFTRKSRHSSSDDEDSSSSDYEDSSSSDYEESSLPINVEDEWMLPLKKGVNLFADKVKDIDPLKAQINPFNSVRIFNFYKALEQKNITFIRQTTGLLEKEEAQYILKEPTHLNQLMNNDFYNSKLKGLVKQFVTHSA